MGGRVQEQPKNGLAFLLSGGPLGSLSPVPVGLISLSPVSARMPSGSWPGLHPDSSGWASLSLQIARPTLCHLATLLGWSKLRATFAEKDIWTILSALVGRGSLPAFVGVAGAPRCRVPLPAATAVQ